MLSIVSPNKNTIEKKNNPNLSHYHGAPVYILCKNECDQNELEKKENFCQTTPC